MTATRISLAAALALLGCLLCSGAAGADARPRKCAARVSPRIDAWAETAEWQSSMTNPTACSLYSSVNLRRVDPIALPPPSRPSDNPPLCQPERERSRQRRISRKHERETMPSARRTPASGPMCPPPGSAIVDLPILTTTTEPMMRTRQPTTTTLENLRIPVQAKLAAAWTSFMFLCVYVDIIAFFKPGTIDEILVGKIWEFDVSQTLLTTFLALMAIPIFMVVLSMTLPARANRITNLIVASVQVPYTAFNMAGESWTYFYGLGFALEVIVLALILRYAWTWPRTAPSATMATMATSPDREAVRAQQQA
jgi:hypothetical protein